MKHLKKLTSIEENVREKISIILKCDADNIPAEADLDLLEIYNDRENRLKLLVII
jgi:hypothetical protein